MKRETGGLVRVNVSAFTGAHFRHREAIVCEVLDFSGDQVLVRTRPPYRVFKLWVSDRWIEDSEEFVQPGVTA